VEVDEVENCEEKFHPENDLFVAEWSLKAINTNFLVFL